MHLTCANKATCVSTWKHVRRPVYVYQRHGFYFDNTNNTSHARVTNWYESFCPPARVRVSKCSRTRCMFFIFILLIVSTRDRHSRFDNVNALIGGPQTRLSLINVNRPFRPTCAIVSSIKRCVCSHLVFQILYDVRVQYPEHYCSGDTLSTRPYGGETFGVSALRRSGRPFDDGGRRSVRGGSGPLCPVRNDDFTIRSRDIFNPRSFRDF